MVCREIRDWLGAGDSRSYDGAVRSVCSTQCMLYSVYVVLGGCLCSVYACSRCMLYLVLTLDHYVEK